MQVKFVTFERQLKNYYDTMDSDTNFKAGGEVILYQTEDGSTSYIDEGYLPYFKQEILDDNRIYSGKAYFIDHALFSHPEIKIEDYSRIVDILSAPNMVKLDERHNNVSLIFIRQYGKYYAEVVRSAEDGKLLLHKTSYYKDKIPQKALPNVEPIKVSEGGSVSIDPAKAVTSTRLSVFDTIGKDTNSSEDSNKSGNIISKKEERRSSLAVETGDVPREEQTVKFSKVTDPEIIRRFNEGEKIVTYREVVLNEDESFNSPMASSPITSPEGICLSVMSSRR